MKQSIVQDKSFTFALRIIKLYLYLKSSKKEFVLSKQILRSGTAIGAITEEAVGAQSNTHFLDIDTDLNELLKMLGKIQITMKGKLKTTRNS